MSDFSAGLRFGKFIYDSGKSVNYGLQRAYTYGGIAGATGATLGLVSASPIGTGLSILGTLYGTKQIYDGIFK
jgi:hypothetical protein